VGIMMGTNYRLAEQVGLKIGQPCNPFISAKGDHYVRL